MPYVEIIKKYKGYLIGEHVHVGTKNEADQLVSQGIAAVSEATGHIPAPGDNPNRGGPMLPDDMPPSDLDVSKMSKKKAKK